MTDIVCFICDKKQQEGWTYYRIEKLTVGDDDPDDEIIVCGFNCMVNGYDETDSAVEIIT